MDIPKVLTDNSWLKDKKTVENKIIELVYEWKPRVGIPHWTIEVTFEKEKPIASCAVAENYLSAQLNFNPKRLLGGEISTNFDLEELVVHEMVHINVWDLAVMTERLIGADEDDENELERQREKLEERTVTLIGRGLVMAKYRLTVIPDSFTAKLAEGWENLFVITDGGDHEPRGSGNT